MISISHKSKQFLVLLIKILIVVAAFYFIYNQLANNDKLDWKKIIVIFKKNQSITGIIFILFLSFLNRFLEILKWQNLVLVIHKISIAEASKQVLASLTLGIFTPNGIGEYAGKALYFDKNQTSKIVFLNLICNGIQLILTIVLGAVGLLILGYWFWVLIILLIGFGLLLLGFFTQKIKIKGYSIDQFIAKIQEIPKKIHQKNIILGIARYITFSHQSYFLYVAFGVQIPYSILMATIITVYLLASSLPSFQFLDFAVKGSVAVYFFSILGVNEWIVVFVTTLMWFLNVVIPVILGSFYVIKFKSNWS